MIEAFVMISDLARRAGVDEDLITEAHGRFFDGHVDIKDAFVVAVFLAEVCRLRGLRSPRGFGPYIDQPWGVRDGAR